MLDLLPDRFEVTALDTFLAMAGSAPTSVEHYAPESE